MGNPGPFASSPATSSLPLLPTPIELDARCMVGELFFSHEVEDIKGSRGYDPRTSLERCLALVGALTGPMGNTAQVHDASLPFPYLLSYIPPPSTLPSSLSSLLPSCWFMIYSVFSSFYFRCDWPTSSSSSHLFFIACRAKDTMGVCGPQCLLCALLSHVPLWVFCGCPCLLLQDISSMVTAVYAALCAPDMAVFNPYLPFLRSWNWPLF